MTSAAAWLVPLVVAPFVGSFLGLAAVRLPAGEPIAFGRSKCRHCRRPLAAYDLIPVVSWILLLGRCRACGARIDPLHPAVEIAAVLVAAWSVAVAPGWLSWVGCGLGWALLLLAAVDWRALVLPDEITLPLLLAGLAFVVAEARDSLLDHVIGAVAGFVVFAFIGWAYKSLRHRPGLGLGDAKLMAAAGAWVSWLGLPSVVAIAAAVALTGVGAQFLVSQFFGSKRMPTSEPMAFGPYLALGLWCVWLYGPLNLDILRAP